MFIPAIAVGQSAPADKKINEIESFKKFTRWKASKDDLKESGKNSTDTSIRVLELNNFNRKKDGLGKVIQRSRYQGTEVKRTCYFNEKGKLFAIGDSIWYDNHTTRQINYYFRGGKLESAITSTHENVTSNINQTELFYWIKSMFDSAEIE